MLSAEWYDAISSRISRRRYSGAPLDSQAAAELAAFCETFSPGPFGPRSHARSTLVARAPADLFTGLVGSYGRIDGAPSAALLVGKEDSDVEIGYVGEAFVLEATRRGLDTCWIAGAFSRKRATALARLADGEQVRAIVAVGTAKPDMDRGEKSMRAFARASSRASIGKLARGADVSTWPPWARTGVEAARLAPSGGNSQPWRFRYESGSLVISKANTLYWTATMDIGIAMLHAELGALHAGTAGLWQEIVDGSDVARFTPD